MHKVSRLKRCGTGRVMPKVPRDYSFQGRVYQDELFLDCFTLKFKAQRSLETLGVTRSTTERHIPEDLEHSATRLSEGLIWTRSRAFNKCNTSNVWKIFELYPIRPVCGLLQQFQLFVTQWVHPPNKCA